MARNITISSPPLFIIILLIEISLTLKLCVVVAYCDMINK